jgi:Mg-chelatase subunit ChlI
MGVNIVEREGISFSHPAKFILIGTMNPEEGDLRPQLLDRFALSVDIRGIREARDRVKIMERNLSFEANPAAFIESWQPEEKKLADQITTAKNLIGEVTYTSRDLIAIASLTASLNVDGHRADLVILKAARAQAAFDGRTKINDLDIALAAELALPHRIKRGPFQQTEVTMEQLSERIQEIQDQMVGEDDGISEQGQGDEAEPAQDEKKK